MPMERHRYPDNWDEIATQVKEEAGWKCEECGKQCRRLGEPFDTHRRTLTVHHRDHTPENCERSNLVALCAPLPSEGRQAPPRANAQAPSRGAPATHGGT